MGLRYRAVNHTVAVGEFSVPEKLSRPAYPLQENSCPHFHFAMLHQRKTGHPIYCDLGTIAGQISMLVVWKGISVGLTE